MFGNFTSEAPAPGMLLCEEVLIVNSIYLLVIGLFRSILFTVT